MIYSLWDTLYRNVKVIRLRTIPGYSAIETLLVFVNIPHVWYYIKYLTIVFCRNCSVGLVVLLGIVKSKEDGGVDANLVHHGCNYVNQYFLPNTTFWKIKCKFCPLSFCFFVFTFMNNTSYVFFFNIFFFCCLLLIFCISIYSPYSLLIIS